MIDPHQRTIVELYDEIAQHRDASEAHQGKETCEGYQDTESEKELVADRHCRLRQAGRIVPERVIRVAGGTTRRRSARFKCGRSDDPVGVRIRRTDPPHALTSCYPAENAERSREPRCRRSVPRPP